MSNTSRVFRNNKMILLSFTGITSDQMLTDESGNKAFPLGDVDWSRIVIETNVTTLTGTSVTFKVVTTNDAPSIATTSVAAVMGNGSTAFASASVTGTGRKMFATGKAAADGSAASNIGGYIGVWADVDTISALAGTINIYIEGR